MKTLASLFLFYCCAWAGEYALLDTGARLHAERHELAAGLVRLYTSSGVSEFPAARITGFEVEEYTPPKPAPQAAVETAAPAGPISEVLTPQELAQKAADKHGLPSAFVHSVMKAESAGRPDAISPKGAIGLMQLMPATARDLGVNPHEPAENVDGGTQYLAELLVKYNGQPELALAAYNAGPAAVDRYKGVPPYRETQAYVDRVLRTYHKLKK